MSATAIPVTIAEDAAARVAELGMQREFEQMIEHAKQTMPHLLALRVTLEYNPECVHEDPSVVIWVHRGDVPPADRVDPLAEEYRDWRSRTFPPEVRLNISVVPVYGGVDGW
jgi:hypothetical protein